MNVSMKNMYLLAKSKKHTAIVFLFVGIVCLTSTFAQVADPTRSSGGSTEQRLTEPKGDTYRDTNNAKSKFVQITFYRPQYGAMPGVASLEVNGHYHSALQLGSYSELCVTPGRNVVAARMAQIGLEPKGFRDATATLNLQEGQRVYLRLLEQGDGRATIAQVRAPIALAELQDTRRQLHVISRVPSATECLAQSKRMIQKETFVLGSDGVFGFGRSDINGISEDGRISVEQVAAHIKSKYGNDKDIVIRVMGHTDPLGQENFNKKLSHARANTIRTQMIRAGINAKQITSEGLGAEQLVIASCGSQPTQENIECNKPNRRVVVGIESADR
jgi:OmpA-OmpF porin, OOP family